MLPLILAALGALQGSQESADAKKEKQAQSLRDASMIKYSPWSGISADKFAGNTYDTPSATNSALAGAAGLGQTGMNIENSKADQAYRKQLADYYTQKDTPTQTPVTPYSGIMQKNEQQDYMNALRDKTMGMGGFGNS